MYAIAKLESQTRRYGWRSPPSGIVRFEQSAPGQPTVVTVWIQGVAPGVHGLHVHEFGSTENGCASMGPHFDDGGMHTHGGRFDLNRHTGDLGNVRADSMGVVAERFTDHRIELSGSRSIIGRGLVLHAQRDDLGRGGNAESLKTGNAGARIACGVIGIDQHESSG